MKHRWLWIIPFLALAFFATINTSGYAQNATATPTFTPTPGPTAVPSQTPLPFIPEGALTATVIRATVLIVRDQPYLGAQRIGSIRRGETYAVIGRDPEARWFLLQLAGKQGWAWGYYLHIDGNEFDPNVSNPFSTSGEPASTADVVVVATSGLKLRTEPNVTADQIGRVTWGGYLPVIGRLENGPWYKVVWKGTPGWIYAPYTKPLQGDINTVPFMTGDTSIAPAANPDYDISIITPTPTATPET